MVFFLFLFNPILIFLLTALACPAKSSKKYFSTKQIRFVKKIFHHFLVVKLDFFFAF